jgi:hypothetical protein
MRNGSVQPREDGSCSSYPSICYAAEHPPARAGINNELLSILIRAALFFGIWGLRHHRGSNRNLFLRGPPCIAGVALKKDRSCNRPQANSTVLSAKIRIGLLVRPGLLSIHFRAPIDFVPHPFRMGYQDANRNGLSQALAAQPVRLMAIAYDPSTPHNLRRTARRLTLFGQVCWPFATLLSLSGQSASRGCKSTCKKGGVGYYRNFFGRVTKIQRHKITY